jgi:hypothetical protein
MFKGLDVLLLSATDLLHFMGCRHSSALDLEYLQNPVAVFPDDPMVDLLARKGSPSSLPMWQSRDGSLGVAQKGGGV